MTCALFRLAALAVLAVLSLPVFAAGAGLAYTYRGAGLTYIYTTELVIHGTSSSDADRATHHIELALAGGGLSNATYSARMKCPDTQGNVLAVPSGASWSRNGVAGTETTTFAISSPRYWKPNGHHSSVWQCAIHVAVVSNGTVKAVLPVRITYRSDAELETLRLQLAEQKAELETLRLQLAERERNRR